MMSPSDTTSNPLVLPNQPDLNPSIRARLIADFERTMVQGLPKNLDEYLLDRYGIDTRAQYAGLPIKNPWGKASGQLSMRTRQVVEDIEAGLGFVVLKTVIGEDSEGRQSMAAWSTTNTRMIAEPIVGASGREGWTITWAGRGWGDSFDDYLNLVRETAALGRQHEVVVAPSVKFHLPGPDAQGWNVDEYNSSTRLILDAFRDGNPDQPMPIEKDFSPTLAASNLATRQARILEWLHEVPALMREAAAPHKIRVGLKLFNAMEDESFQVTMLNAVAASTGKNRPDFLVYANRLFNPNREFDGRKGITYGGPDLSDRNLRALSDWRRHSAWRFPPIEISATGDICSGRLAVEYLLRGCTSFQIHAGFQLPSDVYPCKVGSKVERALQNLIFHPVEGFIAWMLHVSRRLTLPPVFLALSEYTSTREASGLYAEVS